MSELIINRSLVKLADNLNFFHFIHIKTIFRLKNNIRFLINFDCLIILNAARLIGLELIISLNSVASKKSITLENPIDRKNLLK